MSTAEEFLDIGTPENVVFDYEVAGIGSRFLEAMVDTVLIALLLILTNLLLLWIGNLTNLDVGSGDQAALWVAAVLGLISFMILWGYYIFFELSWNGQSPGKRLVGLRVIRTDGAPLGPAESVIRNLIRLIDFLPLYYGVGVIAMFISRRAQRLGDLAAGTLVVYDRGVVTLESLGTGVGRRRPLLGEDDGLDDLPLERLTAQEIALAARFLQRRFDLANEQILAPQLASTLLKRMEVAPEVVADFTALQILRAISAAQREL